MIELCKYISSVGVLKRLDELKMINYGDGISDYAHRVTYDFSKISKGRDGICIYIKFGYLRYFIYEILPSISYRFILVTGDGDEVMPHQLLEEQKFLETINDDRIIKWYSTNCIEQIHHKLSIIPIGVNFHSAGYVANFSGWHEDLIFPLEQEDIIQEIKDKSLPFYEREIKCYSNFHFATYEKFGNPRKEAIENIDKEVVFYEPELTDRTTGWKNQSRYAFVLSPMGNGMDCHRTWEALILGCIVVVKRSPIDSLYEKLPVLIVDNWKDLTDTLLRETIERFKNTEFDLSRITADYWVEKIKSLN